MSTGLASFVARALAGSAIVQGTGMLLTFLVGVQLARGLGVEGYGQYGIAMAVITLASVPAEFGLPKLIVREVAAASIRSEWGRLLGILRWSERASYLMSAAMSATVLLILVAFGAPTSPVSNAILWGIPIIPLAALARLRGAALQGLHHIVLGQIPTILLRPLLYALLLVLLFQILPEAGAGEVMMLNVITAAAAFLLAAFWLRSRLPIRDPEPEPSQRKQWTRSAIILGLANGMAILQAQISILLLALLTNVIEVGLFRIGMSIVVMIAVPMALVATVTSPLLSSLHSSNDQIRLQRLVTSAAWAQFGGVLLIAVPLVAATEQILSFIFGSEYGPAANVLRILCLGQIFSSALGLNATLLKMTGHERQLIHALGIALVVILAVNLLLAPALGAIGSAIAFACSIATWNFVTWRDAKRLLKIDTSVARFPQRERTHVR